MTSYKITTPQLVANLTVGNNVVVQAAPEFHWSVGRDFELVRDYCQKRGWLIEPVIEDARPQFLEMDGAVYELRWNGAVITRIYRYKDGKSTDLRYDDLPVILKKIL